MYQVRQVMPSGRFYVCVNSDEDFIESYQPEDEHKEWRRTGHVGDISAREITKVEVRELLVKLRGYSYLRSKWLSVAEIEADGPLSNPDPNRNPSPNPNPNPDPDPDPDPDH